MDCCKELGRIEKIEATVEYFKKRVYALEDVIRSDPKKLSMFSAIQERDKMIFNLEQRLSDSENENLELKRKNTELKKDWIDVIDQKNNYIESLENTLKAVKADNEELRDLIKTIKEALK